MVLYIPFVCVYLHIKTFLILVKKLKLPQFIRANSILFDLFLDFQNFI